MLFLAACTPGTSRPTPLPGETQQIRASDGETGIITVTYPAQWVAIEQADHSISLANSPQALRSYDIDITELQDGHIAGTVSALKRNVIPVDIDNTPEGVLGYITDTVTAQSGRVNYSFGTVEAARMDGRDGAVSEGFGVETDSETVIEVRLLVIEADDAYGIMFFGAPFDELTPQYAMLEDIAASFQFEPIPSED
jgi:hypothetical protein